MNELMAKGMFEELDVVMAKTIAMTREQMDYLDEDEFEEYNTMLDGLSKAFIKMQQYYVSQAVTLDAIMEKLNRIEHKINRMELV